MVILYEPPFSFICGKLLTLLSAFHFVSSENNEDNKSFHWHFIIIEGR